MTDNEHVLVPLVHAVTNDEIVRRPEFEDCARRVMERLGPAGAVHLRAQLGGAVLHGLAERLARVQSETGCWLVVNDRLDVALAARARGVQLTSRSITVADARAIAGEAWLGASVHDLDAARIAEREGANWAVAGHVFPTRSHPDEPPRGVDFVRELSAAVRIPVVAIGGILPPSVPGMRAAGAHGVAVIRGIWNAADAADAASEYLSMYGEERFHERRAARSGER